MRQAAGGPGAVAVDGHMVDQATLRLAEGLWPGLRRRISAGQKLRPGIRPPRQRGGPRGALAGALPPQTKEDLPLRAQALEQELEAVRNELKGLSDQ